MTNNLPEKYTYPAVFDFHEDGITVTFPDLPGCITCGDDEAEALAMAKEVLELFIFGMEEDGDAIPEPSPVESVKLEENERCFLITTGFMPDVRKEIEEYNAPIEIKVTIPQFLADWVKEKGIDINKAVFECLDDKRFEMEVEKQG